MVIPPPNVTGRLHIGHALGRTLEDVLARWKRMQGYRVLWVPGTDHAGIATQMVIERQLAAEGTDRKALGREAFIERVWAWKREAKDTIQTQMKRLGCSLDWTRERFTLDPDLSRAVRRAFVQLWKEDLIYRGRYVVNWCPRCGTAVSDLEVVHREVDGKLYKIRYDVPGVPSGAVVATTRPETMLGDTALAIHPEDPRTAALRGRKAILPIVGREIPIIEDPILVDREFGTGVVKVTPAHDANDFATAERHELPAVVVIGPDAKMTAEAGAAFAGLDRFKARKAVLDRLEAEGRLVATEDHRHALGHCQRCDTVIEPYLSTQWFVKIQPLAEPAIRAVEDGTIRFVPESWAKTYFEWMRNIHDWCISRQLWWGHRIPAFHCDNGHITVSEEDPTACATCGSGKLQQDPDVLDTWFSSQLWPFSVFGWPDETTDLKVFYPTDVLVTGYDILFFWVARMIMAGLHFTGNGAVPHGPSARPRARGRREDVQDQGQRDRPAGGDRRIRRRRRPLRARRGGFERADGLPREAPPRRLAGLRDEALERVAFRPGAVGSGASRGQAGRPDAGASGPLGALAPVGRRGGGLDGSSRSSASTKRRRRSTPSSGTSSATVTSRWSSRASRARRRGPRAGRPLAKRSRAA